MKTILFILGVAFNVFLCSFPFNEQVQVVPQQEKTTVPAISQQPEQQLRQPLSYSTLLKNKAGDLAQK